MGHASAIALPKIARDLVMTRLATVANAHTDIEVLSDPLWQMTFGERMGLEGVLTQVKPKLAIELGSAQGGSLRRIAKHSKEVHSFDIEPEVAELGKEIKNVTFHIGDSAVVVPEVLNGFVKKRRHIDFALIDGDHTSEGVKRDALAVVNSDACQRTVIIFHDTANDEVRAGIEAAELHKHPKVGLCLLDFIPGYLVVKGHDTYSLASWNGLGLVVLDPKANGVEVDDEHYSVAEVYDRVRPLFDDGVPAGAPSLMTRVKRRISAN